MTTPKLTFGEWLHRYRGRNPVIGDLRDDFRRSCRLDRRAPSEFKTPSALRAEMVAVGACSEALAALREAGTAYRASAKAAR
ncbi:MAG: hypothetical protein RLZZ32_1778 [Cyanobacteriota bacterium]|jgi:hypothetical protein